MTSAPTAKSVAFKNGNTAASDYAYRLEQEIPEHWTPWLATSSWFQRLDAYRRALAAGQVLAPEIPEQYREGTPPAFAPSHHTMADLLTTHPL